MSKFLMVTIAFLALPGTITAQQHPLVGEWKVTYAGGMRLENGVPTPIEATAAVTIELMGDSLIAQFRPEPIEGQTRPPFQMAAVPRPDGASFVRVSEATLNVNGETQQRTTITRWALTVDGDALSGTIERSIEGVDLPTGGPQPVSGTRQHG